MNTRDLRELGEEALRERETELRQELMNLRFQHATRQLENTARITEVKRQIARVLTVVRERELAKA